eukprot:4626582-Pyramimonas_sp.AAC.1
MVPAPCAGWDFLGRGRLMGTSWAPRAPRGLHRVYCTAWLPPHCTRQRTPHALHHVELAPQSLHRM